MARFVQQFAMVVGALVTVIHAAPPTFQQLMSPDCLRDAQHGMRVESAELDADHLRATTTGAIIDGDLRSGTIVFHQRIGAQRDVVRLKLNRPLTGGDLEHQSAGFALSGFASPRVHIRINGDSLFMLHVHEPVQIEVAKSIQPGFVSSHGSNHVLFDEYGGFGLYCSQAKLADRFDPYADTTARYDLPADSVLWVAVCPPKPYDWKQSTTEHVVWHWSNQSAYPPDDVLRQWSAAGNIVLLQSEVMLWKDWNLAFEPRLGPAEFARVRDTVHRLGMRFIVYTSPHYFLTGTGREAAAMNSFENFKNWPSGTTTGENMDRFLAEIAKVMRDFKPDGLYFDGQYSENPAALYLLARRAREIVGEAGLLEWHSTNALGPDLCSLPTADAYIDLILRGEGRESNYGDDDYLRYFVSGYNIHNSVGVLCNNGSRPNSELIQRLLAVNGRMHTLAGWLADPGLARLIEQDYKAALSKPDELTARVESYIRKRQDVLPARIEGKMREYRGLAAEPAWSKPIVADAFGSLQGWEQVSSPLNTGPFHVGDDILTIRARSHTYAYLQRSLGTPVSGFVARLRRGDDQGMSWGPAVLIRWDDHRFLRVGLRSDNLLQADISGDQRYHGPIATQEWCWLRARWLERSGVIELSSDGRDYKTVWRFQHSGAMSGPARTVCVGKVPYNGQAADYPEAGPLGESTFADLRVFGQDLK